jgi:hypothetical protein
MSYDILLHGDAISVFRVVCNNIYAYTQYSLVMTQPYGPRRIRDAMVLFQSSGCGNAIAENRNPDHSHVYPHWSYDFILRPEGQADHISCYLDRTSPLVKEILLNHPGDRTVFPTPGNKFRMVFKDGRIVDILEVPEAESTDQIRSCKTGELCRLDETCKERANRECIEDGWMVRNEDGKLEQTELGKEAFRRIREFYFGDDDKG